MTLAACQPLIEGDIDGTSTAGSETGPAATSAEAETGTTGANDHSGAEADSSGVSAGSSGTATSTAEASTAGSREVCGNGATEASETCDDGNQDELDGCTSACEEGPLGLTFSDSELTLDEFGGWVEPVFAGVSECPPDATLVGVSGEFSDYFQYYVLGRIRGICAPVELTNTAPADVAFGTVSALSEVGLESGDPFELMCPENAALTGFFGSSGLYTDSLGITCRGVGLAPGQGRILLGSRAVAGPFGAPRESDAALDCPDDSIAVGFDAVGDTYAARFRLRCAEPRVLTP